MNRFSFSLLWLLLFLAFTAPTPSLAQATNTNSVGQLSTNTPSTNQTNANSALKQALDSHKDDLNSFVVVSAAFLVGFLGAAAFFCGVSFGFITRESRAQVMEFLSTYRGVFIFFFFGGVVAAVFQLAQPSVFAPIQAFVLGATWPSVVTRIMTGNTTPTGLSSLLNVPASQVPTPPAAAAANNPAASAQVVIKPKQP